MVYNKSIDHVLVKTSNAHLRHLTALLNLDRTIFVQLIFHFLKIELSFACPHSLHIWYCRVFFTFEDGINLFQRLSFGLDPIYSLQPLSIDAYILSGKLTMRMMITISQDPLIMYIFHPMFSSPIGMTKTNTHLVRH